MDKKIINKYFREFILNHKEVISFEEDSASIINEIEKKANVSFHKDWNYLMVLILIIENQYHVRSIITQDNYVAFEFENYKIQDKGFTKFEAFYIVCFKTLQEFWVEGKTSASYHNTEPFDEYDLK